MILFGKEKELGNTWNIHVPPNSTGKQEHFLTDVIK